MVVCWRLSCCRSGDPHGSNQQSDSDSHQHHRHRDSGPVQQRLAHAGRNHVARLPAGDGRHRHSSGVEVGPMLLLTYGRDTSRLRCVAVEDASS